MVLHLVGMNSYCMMRPQPVVLESDSEKERHPEGRGKAVDLK